MTTYRTPSIKTLQTIPGVDADKARALKALLTARRVAEINHADRGA